MILKMQKLTLIGFLEEKDALLRDLMKKKCVQIQNPEDIGEYTSIQEISSLGISQTYDLEQELAKFAAAIKAVSDYAPKGGGLFDKKEAAPFSTLLDDSLYQKAVALRDQISDITKQIADLKSSRSRESFQIASLEPWSSLDTDLSQTSTKFCNILYLVLPTTTELSELENQLSQATDLCYLNVVSETPENRFLAILYHQSAQEDVLGVLKTFNTTKPDFSSFTGTVADNRATLLGQVKTYDNQISALTEQLKTAGQQIDLLKTGYDIVGTQIDDQKAREKIFQTESVFALSGWIIKDEADKVKKVLDKYNCYYQIADPAAGEEPPVKLKNSPLVKPFELITEMYSLPTPDGIDPTPAIMPFFILFFGMMLADGGYGLLILILCLVGLKKVKPTDGFLYGALHMGVWCGASTILWGAIYGGWFGNLVTQVAESWFGKTVTIPALLDPLGDPMTIMIISFGFGLVHLFTGMGIKAYMMIKRGDVAGAVFDIGLWYVLLIGLILLAVQPTIGMYVAIAGALGLILTQGRHEKNILMKPIKGVMSLYDITSYLSDTLSYARILALGLAGGVIANVINIMGTLPGFNIIGILAFVLIFLGGHAFNLAISGLGAYVHTSRLQYVEFFGKFYEAGGVPFKPFKANTKYTLITDKEEI